MAYANLDDVLAILPQEDQAEAEAAADRIEVNLEEATDLVKGYLEREYTGADTDGVPSDVPPAVRRVVARVTLRGFMDEPDNPGAEGEVAAMGPFSHTINWSREAQARDFYLTDSDKMRLEPYVAGYSGGAVHLPMAGACGDLWNQAYQ